MDSLKNAIASMCAFNVKNDRIMRAFSRLADKDVTTALEAYSEICSVLLFSRKSLGDYLHDMLVYSDSPFIAECADCRDELMINAVAHDIAIINVIAIFGSETVKKELSSRHQDSFIKHLPDYMQGDFDYSVEYFLEHVQKHGCGDIARYRAFTYRGGALHPIEDIDPIRLSDLKRYETQRAQVVENTECFVKGGRGLDVLLYGDRGTGKSSTVKALLNEYEALRMVELPKSEIAQLPALFGMLKKSPMRFIITIDDLTFSEQDERFGILKAALEGGLTARPENVLIYATTNRRKLIKETIAQRNEDISRSDAVDESMSLADRFGLYVTFTSPNKEVYLDIVRQLAADAGISITEDSLLAQAESFAIRRSGRSPRVARQFIEQLRINN